jgi:regulatory protein
MAGRRRGRTGRGWDAAPPRPPREPRQPGRDDRQIGDVKEPSDPGARAREICLRLLAVRPRTRSELATALRQRGIEEGVAAEVLARYAEVGMIDDRAFARAWVSSRHHGRGLARRALATELRQKGVDAETVGAALEELSPQTEAETARALVDRKLRTESPPRGSTYPERRAATEALLRRLVGMLARKGYAPGLAVRVVREAIDEWAGATVVETDLDLVVEGLDSEAAADAGNP